MCKGKVVLLLKDLHGTIMPKNNNKKIGIILWIIIYCKY